ncbi:hypothetical protein PGQ11_001818 [Apiospora arundinis]|uniref:Uncharacterized protein n=1 Tax=Apiospora arundinis TaxID=335852 RepID=A0ABR2JGV9_9PEZI
MMDFRQDMVFSTSLYWNYLNEFDFPPQLRNPHRSGGYVDHLRHLALPLFDIAYWPSMARAESFTSPESSPNFCPRFKDGVLTLLRLARNLRTLHIVADRFFSTGDSSSAEHRTPTRDNLDPFRSILDYATWWRPFLETIMASSGTMPLPEWSTSTPTWVDMSFNHTAREKKYDVEAHKDIAMRYKRYFARSSSALEWYADVSGYEWTDNTLGQFARTVRVIS